MARHGDEKEDAYRVLSYTQSVPVVVNCPVVLVPSIVTVLGSLPDRLASRLVATTCFVRSYK